MHIWVDADACPGAIKEILERAARRLSLPLTFVANKALSLAPAPNITLLRVGKGFDVVDETIAGLVQQGDIVITADIPLAAKIVEKGATGLNPRGEAYTKETIGPKLTMRNLMDELRSSGVATGGPGPLSQRDRNNFAAQLERLLSGRPLA